jgi:hypothetical protein
MTNLEAQTGLIFIGGSPRSGTTMVQNILDSHTDILGLPEFKHLRDIIFLKNQLDSSVDKKLIHDFCKPEQIDQQFKELIQRLLIDVKQDKSVNKKGASTLSEKTPANVLVFQDLEKLYPSAKFIFVLRDPRGIINSLRNVKKKALKRGVKPPGFSMNLSKAIEHTKAHIEAGISFTTKYPDKAITVVYEELVRQPEKETRRLCEFLGVSWEESMLFPSRKRHLNEKTMTNYHNANFYDKQQFSRDPDKNNVGKWRKELPLKSRIIVSNEFKEYKVLDQYYHLQDYFRLKVFYRWISVPYYLGESVKQKIDGVKILLRKFVTSYG